MPKRITTLVVCLTILIWMGIQLQPLAQDAFLDDDTGSSLSPADNEPYIRTVKINPFFKFSSPLLRVSLFLLFMAIFFGIAMLIFQRALKREDDPTSAFFTGNFILCLGLLIFGFLCFSDYVYPGNAKSLGEHFSKVNWYVYLILIVLFIILMLLGRGSPAQRQIQETANGSSSTSASG